MSLAQSSKEQRRAPREAVDLRSRIAARNLAPAPAFIVNISPYGCMVRSECTVPVGAKLTVELPGLGMMGGLVIWSLGARIGIEFDEGLPLEPYLAMLSHEQAPQPQA